MCLVGGLIVPAASGSLRIIMNKTKCLLDAITSFKGLTFNLVKKCALSCVYICTVLCLYLQQGFFFDSEGFNGIMVNDSDALTLIPQIERCYCI